MMDKHNGGPAFPVAEWDSASFRYINTGMTLRDYFAAKAMQGMMANAWNQNYNAWAEHAYKMADAMLSARKE